MKLLNISVLRDLGTHKYKFYLCQLISILEPKCSKEILFPVRSHDLRGSLGNFFFQSYYSDFKPFISSSVRLPSMCHQSRIDSGMVFSSALFHILLPFHLKLYTYVFGKQKTFVWYLTSFLIQTLNYSIDW